MPTLNERAHELANAMAADTDRLGIAVHTLPCGTRIIDCGVKATGSVEAGVRLAEVCTAGLAIVDVLPEKGGRTYPGGGFFDPSPLYQFLGTKYVFVNSDNPVAACMASQYAGWKITGKDFFAMGSGPMRAAAGEEELFNAIDHREKAERCVGVLECSQMPTEEACLDIAEKCGISPNQLTLLIARTSSAAGTLQIVARSLETALHKLHELGFDLSLIQSGFGVAPLPPLADDDITAIGWTNDAILYGGWVGLFVTADEELIKNVGPRVPSSASPDFGRPFGEIFKSYGGDFYAIDPMLFSPAQIGFVNTDHFHDMQYGRLAPEVLVASFGSRL